MLGYLQNNIHFLKTLISKVFSILSYLCNLLETKNQKLPMCAGVFSQPARGIGEAVFSVGS